MLNKPQVLTAVSFKHLQAGLLKAVINDKGNIFCFNLDKIKLQRERLEEPGSVFWFTICLEMLFHLIA